jgi:hypothetical protein
LRMHLKPSGKGSRRANPGLTGKNPSNQLFHCAVWPIKSAHGFN